MFRMFTVIGLLIITYGVCGMYENQSVVQSRDNSRTLYYFQPEINCEQSIIYMRPVDDNPRKKFDSAMYVFNSGMPLRSDVLEKMAVGVVESSLDGYTPVVDYLLYTCRVPERRLIIEKNKQYLVEKILEKVREDIDA